MRKNVDRARSSPGGATCICTTCASFENSSASRSEEPTRRPCSPWATQAGWRSTGSCHCLNAACPRSSWWTAATSETTTSTPNTSSSPWSRHGECWVVSSLAMEAETSLAKSKRNTSSVTREERDISGATGSSCATFRRTPTRPPAPARSSSSLRGTPTTASSSPKAWTLLGTSSLLTLG